MKKRKNKWMVLLATAILISQMGSTGIVRGAADTEESLQPLRPKPVGMRTESPQEDPAPGNGEDLKDKPTRNPGQMPHPLEPARPWHTPGVTESIAPPRTPAAGESTVPPRTPAATNSAAPSQEPVDTPGTEPVTTPSAKPWDSPVPTTEPLTDGTYQPTLTYVPLDAELSYTLKWNGDQNRYLDHYEIYSCVGNRNGEYAPMQSVTGTEAQVTLLRKGQITYYKVRAVYTKKARKFVPDEGFVTYALETAYSAFSEPVGIVYPLEKVQRLKVMQDTRSSLRITWEKVEGAVGYVIERSVTEAGGYQQVAQIDSDSTAYKDTGLETGRTYYYRIYAYSINEGVMTAGVLSSVMSGIPLLQGTKNISARCISPKRMKIKWNPVADAKGYVVYMTGADNAKWKKYKVVSGNKNTTVTRTVSNGKCYGVRIMAYCNVKGSESEGAVQEKNVYGDYYGYRKESFESRQKRVYGSLNKGEYKTSGQAQKHMTTIKVKVWDFARGMSGKKVTKTKYLTCNKAVASTLKKIFQKIYHGKEKAPIYELGCYSWRSGQHGQGLAVDINSNYNAMFDNGKVSAGKCWKPKKYAYSIKRNGDIEKAFAEYGFTRGLWGSRKDYMHFSYFGS